jgi:hypothetical protein
VRADTSWFTCSNQLPEGALLRQGCCLSLTRLCSDGTLLRYIFSLLSIFCALSIICITFVQQLSSIISFFFHFHSLPLYSYIIGIYDLDIVQGGFNIFKETQFARSAIAFPVVSIVAGVVLFVVGKII